MAKVKGNQQFSKDHEKEIGYQVFPFALTSYLFIGKSLNEGSMNVKRTWGLEFGIESS